MTAMHLDRLTWPEIKTEIEIVSVLAFTDLEGMVNDAFKSSDASGSGLLSRGCIPGNGKPL